MDEAPIITPSQFLSLEGVRRGDSPSRVALIAFCPLHGLKARAHAQPLSRSLFVHLGASHQFQGLVEGRPVLMVECVYGGPVCATVLEEMAWLGMTHAVGFGYAGSLQPSLVPGSIVVARSALVSDGTSREYTGDREVEASHDLLAAFDRLSPSLRRQVKAGKAWTTDALYREYPSKVQAWREAGADFVNMDTSPFYAVSRAVGIEALYLALISDYVGGESWQEEFRDLDGARDTLHEALVELVGLLPGPSA